MLSKGCIIAIITGIAAVIAGTIVWLRMGKLITVAKDNGDHFPAVYFAFMAVIIEIVIMGGIIFVGTEISLLVDPEWIIRVLERI